MKKRVLTFVFVMLLTALMIAPASAIVKQSDKFYVADYANVIDATTEQDIIEANAYLESNCDGAQIVVVSVEYLDGLYADEYALRVMNDWGVGDADENNGMVMLFATKENKGWLATGDGIDSTFTDAMANEYLDDYFWKHYDNGNYDKAVKTLFPELVEWYEVSYSQSWSDRVTNSFAGIMDFMAEFLYIITSNDIVFFLFLISIYGIISFIREKKWHYKSYYTHIGTPAPRFRIWHLWHGPHIHWHDPKSPKHHIPFAFHSHGSGGHGGGGSGRGGFGGGMGRGGGGRSGGGGGGRR